MSNSNQSNQSSEIKIPASLSMFGKGLKHPETGEAIRVGYKKFSIEVNIPDLLAMACNGEERAKEVIRLMTLELVKDMASGLERELSISNFPNKSLFDPTKPEESGKFFKELIDGFTLEDLVREAQNTLENRGKGAFNGKMWMAWVKEMFLSAVQAYRTAVLFEPPLPVDKIKANESALRAGQKMKPEGKQQVIDRVLRIIEATQGEGFGNIPVGSKLERVLNQPENEVSKEKKAALLETFNGWIDILNTFANNPVTMMALEWLSKEPQEIPEIDLGI